MWRENAFYLNGERVRLCGTEWMPGSDPVYGAAEPEEQMEKMLRLLKESNCVFTRFHWQQDDFILDWCDRHGMLVQEEVPFWGPDPEKAGGLQTDIALQQLEEMSPHTKPSLCDRLGRGKRAVCAGCGNHPLYPAGRSFCPRAGSGPLCQLCEQYLV